MLHIYIYIYDISRLRVKFITNNKFSARFTTLVIRQNNAIQSKVNLHVCKYVLSCITASYSAASADQNVPLDTTATEAKVNCVCKQIAI